MNKKIIAIAIATAMAAPVAMADVKVSGRVGVNFVSIDDDGALAAALPAGAPGAQAYKDSLANYKTLGFNLIKDAETAGTGYTTLSEHGMNRLVFDGTSGDAYARIALNNAGGKTNPSYRDLYAGYKASFGKIQIGRMAGAIKNLEKDPYIATFLQVRGTFAAAGGKYGSNGFIDNLIQYSTKANGISFKVQYNPTKDTASAKDEGHTGLAVTGKAASVNWWVGYNNVTGSEKSGSTNTKIGASMKFGQIKATLQIENNKYDQVVLKDGLGGNVTLDLDGSRTLLMADMGLGNGLSINAALGQGSDDLDGSFMRLAINKKLNKGTSMFAGYTSQEPEGGDAMTTIGAGLTVKF